MEVLQGQEHLNRTEYLMIDEMNIEKTVIFIKVFGRQKNMSFCNLITRVSR